MIFAMFLAPGVQISHLYGEIVCYAFQVIKPLILIFSPRNSSPTDPTRSDRYVYCVHFVNHILHLKRKLLGYMSLFFT